MPPTARRIMLRPSRQIEIQTLRKGEATPRQGHLLPLPVAAPSCPAYFEWLAISHTQITIYVIEMKERPFTPPPAFNARKAAQTDPNQEFVHHLHRGLQK